MQKWFAAAPELVEVGESVRKWDSELDFYVEVEVLKVCPKTFLVLKFDKKREVERPVYIRVSVQSSP